MNLKSFLRFFTQAWRKSKTSIRNKPVGGKAIPWAEVLEQRELLTAGAPSIVSALVLPLDGSTLATGTPVIQVVYSEAMGPSALDKNNYLLFGSSGRIAVNSVSFVNAPTNTIVNVQYNGNEGGDISQVSNTSDIVITTAVPNSLVTGNHVTITGVPGLSPTSYSINVNDSTHFSLNGSVAVGTFSNVGRWYLSGAVTGASNIAGSPIVIQSTTHGLADGDQVNIAGVLGNTNANGTWIVTKIDVDHFSLNGSSGNGSYTSGGTWDANDPLVVDNYSLYVRGDHVFDVDAPTPSPLSPISQLVVASAGQSRVAVANLTGSGGLGALGDYAIPPVGAIAPLPFAVATGDLNADGLPDLVVVDSASGADQAQVFLGQLAANGGGFNQNPDVLLNLPASAATAPRAIAIADFNNDGKPDLAIANGNTSNFSVFLNTGTVGSLSFGSASSYATDTNPLGIVAADLDQDGNMDLAVVVNGAASTVDVLRGNGAGVFAAYSTALINGSPVGVGTSIGAGRLNTDARPDLVVGGSTGLAWLRNTGGMVFAVPSMIFAGPPAVVAVAVGAIDAGSADDIVATTSTNLAQVWLNDGKIAPTFTLVGAGTAIPAGTAGAVALGDLDANGHPDLVITNNQALPNARVTTVQNFTVGGTISNVTLDAGNHFVITSNGHALVTGDQVTISGVVGTSGMTGPGPNSVNGSWTVTVIDKNTFSLPTSIGLPAAVYTGGTGVWVQSGTISNAVVTNTPAFTNDIVITSSAHGLATGDQVNITGVNGTIAPSANGTFTITRIDANNFSLNISTGSGIYNNSPTPGTWTTLPSFVTPLSNPYAVDARPTGVVVVDTNQDGFADVVTANQTGNDFSLLLSAGDGSLLSATSYGALPNQTRNVATGDLNADGVPDIVVINDNFGPAIPTASVLIGKPNGTYFAAVNFTLPSGGASSMNTLTSVAIGDVTGDGKPDIVVASNGGDGVGILANSTPNGNNVPSFSFLQKLGTGQRPTDLVLGDFNGDHKLDIAVSHNRAGGGFGGNRQGVSYLQQDSVTPGTFLSSVEILSGGGQLLRQPLVGIETGDFNKDGKLDFVAIDNNSPGNVYLALGNGDGTFSSGGSYTTLVPNPTSVAVADFNLDGYPDVVVSSGSNSITNAGVAVLLNQLGTGFGVPIQKDVVPGTALASVLATDLNADGAQDLIVSTAAGGGGATLDNVYVLMGQGNAVVAPAVPYLIGNLGAPATPTSYLALTGNALVRVTSFTSGGALVNTPTINNGDFESRNLAGETGSLVGWQTYKLSDTTAGSHGQWMTQTGNASPLSGVSVPSPAGTYRAMLDEANLDWQGAGSSAPFWSGVNKNPNLAASYNGTNVLYQDVFVPANATQVSIVMSVYVNNDATPLNLPTAPGFTSAPSLDYRFPGPNQQVRVDLVDPTDAGGILSLSGVYKTLYATAPGDAPVSSKSVAYTFTALEVAGFAGKTVRLRIAAAYNQAQLIVGVDNVKMTVQYSDQAKPVLLSNTATATTSSFVIPAVSSTAAINVISTAGMAIGQSLYLTGNGTTGGGTAVANTILATVVGISSATNVTIQTSQITAGIATNTMSAGASVTITGVSLRNPGFPGSPTGTTPHTSDPTFVGQIVDDGGIGNVSFVEIDPTNSGFTGINVIKTATWDAKGNFSITLPNVPPGLTTIGIRVVDKPGNSSTYTATFFMQSSSVTEWEAVGPQGIAVSGQANINYTSVSGRITATVVDAADPTGNTYFVGSANGGVWRTTDSGASWTPLTDNVLDGTNNPVPVPIGGLAQSTVQVVGGLQVLNTRILYAGTGVGDLAADSHTSIGVLKSTDNGSTWTVIGNSSTVFAGARIVKMLVDAKNADFVYAAVASGGVSGPGVYKSTDGGLTWSNVLKTPSATLGAPNSNMNLTPAPVGAGGTVNVATALASVTDMVMDPFNSNHIIIGLGNMGLIAASATAGVWQTYTGGASWDQVVGGNESVPGGTLNGNPTPASQGFLPAGLAVGRITIGIGTGRVGDERYVYVLIGDPPPAVVTPPNVNFGGMLATAASGLYRTKDNLTNFTKVMLKEDKQGAGPGIHNFVDIDLLGREASNTGALAVDPNDPNVVYVGGSDRWNKNVAGNRQHALIRVDTGNMRDTTFQTRDYPGNPFPGPTHVPNDGDDVDKYRASEPRPTDILGAPNTNYYDFNNLVAPVDPYVGEGVYWYDLIEGTSGRSANAVNLPPAITKLNFDSQGRLLIGTVGGIWRGQNFGFSYDRTSGNRGILSGGFGPPPPAFSTKGMGLTSINGNLQISDLTSVALDPLNPGSFYTTQNDTGVAGSTQALVWVSQGVIGPTLPAPLGNLGIPNAGLVLAANPAPGSPAGTPITLYRIWQYADPNALQPEVSNDNGLTWNSLPNTGLAVAGSTGGVYPAFTVNPTPIQNGVDAFGNPQYFTELLFGTNKVFLTQTGGNAWGDITTRAALSGAGGLVTSLAISPTNLVGVSPPQNAFYAGTDLGEIFVTLSAGGDNWPQQNAGLPAGKKINGLTVDPTNPLVVYAAIDGAGAYDHVWRGVTTPGASPTISWASISSPSSGLPQFAAYKIVVDPRVGLGAPGGKIYVATEIGVYVSSNGGGSWQKLGRGMPNVPVVGLDFNSSLETLAAAALGRGVFTINTSAISVVPNQALVENSISNLIPFTVNDPGLPLGSYTVTASSDNQTLVPNGSIVLGGSGQNRTIQFTPAPNTYTPQNGVANITISLTSAGTTFTSKFQVTVTFVNQAPTYTTAVNNGLPSTFTLPLNTTKTINFTVNDVEDDFAAPVVTVATTTGGSGAGSEVQTVTVAAGTITGVSINASSNYVVTSTAHGLVTGQQVAITGVSGTGGMTVAPNNINNTWFVTRIDVDHFALNSSTGVGAYSSGGTWSLTGTFSLTFNNRTTGTLAYNVAASGGVGPTASMQNALNALLSIGGAGGSVAVTQLNNVYTVTFAGTLANTDVPQIVASSGLYVTATSDNAGLIPNSGLNVVAGPGGARTLFITPLANTTGTANVTVTIVDSIGGLTGTTTKTINVLVNTTATLPFSDNFARPGNTFLGPGWNEGVIGDFSVAGQKGVASGAGVSFATLNGPSIADVSQTADVTLNVGSGLEYTALIARYGGNGVNMYWGGLIRYNTGGPVYAQIFRNLNGAWASIAQTVVGSNAGTLRFDVVGDSLKLFLGGSLVAFGNDSALAAAGMIGFNATQNGSYDNYSAAAITLAAGAYPDDFTVTGAISGATVSSTNPIQITTPVALALSTGDQITISGNPVAIGTYIITVIDPFNFYLNGTATGASAFVAGGSYTLTGTQLTSLLTHAWQDRTGDFSISTASNAAIGTGAFNVATRTGVSQGDFVTSADIAVSAVNGSFAGLAARYTGSGTGSFYWGGLVQSGGTTLAQIYRIFNGAFALLSSQTVSASAIARPLQFELIGDAMKLFLDSGAGPVLVGFANDFALTSTTATVGLLASAGNLIDNFILADPAPYTSPAPVLPFSGDFSGSSGAQLNLDWRYRSGNFSMTGANAVISSGAVSLATVNGYNQEDGFIQANVTLAAANGAYAGVAARYSGFSGAVGTNTGVANLYFGGLFRTSANTASAQILRNLNGIWTVLSSANITYVPGQTLRLDVLGDSLKLSYNSVVVTSTYDVSLTSGTFGILGSAGNTLDTFTANALTPVLNPTFADNFDRADGSLGASWAARAGALAISSNAVTGNAASNLSTVIGINQANESVHADVTLAAANGSYAGVVARYAGTGVTNFYWAGLVRSGSATLAQIYRFVNGSATLLNSQAVTASGPGTVLFEVAGDSLEVFYNGTLAAYANDTSLTNGSVGLLASMGNTVDNFAASKITLTTPVFAPGFTDSFASGTQLDRNWLNHAGNLSITSPGTLTANAAINLATLNGVSMSDVVIDSSVDLGVSGAYAGVVARQSGAGLTNLYWGGLVRSGGTAFAQIYRFVNGSATLLNSQAAGSLSGSLKFLVVGNSLQLFLGGTLVAAANDASLTTGSAGFLASQGNTFGAFGLNTATPGAATIPPSFSDTTLAGSVAGASLDTASGVWQNRAGAFDSVGAATAGFLAGNNLATVRLTANLTDTTVEADLAVAGNGSYVGVLSRYTAGAGLGNFYWAGLVQSGASTFAQIFRFVNGAGTLLANQALGNLNGSAVTIRLDVINDSLKLYLDTGAGFALVAHAFDSALTTGTVGLLSSQGNAVTRFSTDTLALTTATLPFAADTFTAADGTQLAGTYRERVGNYSVKNNALEGKDALNLAVLNGVSATDVNVQANVAFSTVNQTAGLAARYTGAGDSNMYLAYLVYQGGNTVTAHIYRNVNGTWTLLAIKTNTAFAAGALFGFQVNGSTLTLLVNNVAVLSATDSMITTGGSLGIRSSAGVQFDNFTAS